MAKTFGQLHRDRKNRKQSLIVRGWQMLSSPWMPGQHVGFALDRFRAVATALVAFALSGSMHFLRDRASSRSSQLPLLRNAAPLPIAAVRAVAVSGPTPGIVSSRRQPSSANRANSWLLASICSSSLTTRREARPAASSSLARAGWQCLRGWKGPTA